jgi:alkaline phosphatase D
LLRVRAARAAGARAARLGRAGLSATFTRRDVLRGIGAAGLGTALHHPLAVALDAGPGERFRFDDAPFTLGVASGDPTAQSVVLWTRLAPQPLDAAGLGGLSGKGVPVEWALALDPQMRQVVARGRTVADAARGYSVHVDAGGLRPGTTYYYRFAAAGQSSRVGRTRTLPEVARGVRFACVSCQDLYSQYGAFRNLARESLDFVVHLGDTIYESSWDGRPATDLPSFRNKHALFRGDPLAREAWAAHPFLVTWDDHEVQNDYWGTDPRGEALRAAGYQAFYEHMPLRLPAGEPERWSALRIYRTCAVGDLLELALLDLRQYRDAPVAAQVAAEAPGRTMLGAGQKHWLLERLRERATNWLCIGSPSPVSDYRATFDSWAGYAQERRDLLGAIRASAGRTVVVSGDSHRSLVSPLLLPRDREPGGEAVAMEFGVPALSSKALAPERPDPDAGFVPPPQAPWVIYQDLGYRGYVVCDVDRDAWRATYRVLRDGSSRCMTTLASFEVSGAGGATRTSGFVPFTC